MIERVLYTLIYMIVFDFLIASVLSCALIPAEYTADITHITYNDELIAIGCKGKIVWIKH